MKPKKDGNKNVMGIVTIVFWALVVTLLFNSFLSMYRNSDTVTVPYSTFKTWVSDGYVTSVDLESSKYTFVLKDGVTVTANSDGTYTAQEGDSSSSSASTDSLSAGLQNGKTATTYITIPGPTADKDIYTLLDSYGVSYSTQPVAQNSYITSLLLNYILPMFLMIGLMLLLFRGLGSRMGDGLGGVGKSNAKVYVEKSTGVTFADVAGQDEAKESLVELIDFLHNPGKYTEIGAKLPKGALLVGSPGTGKTLLAKAVAGEANVPFFSISGSDFVEMFVGVGASRVRDLFKEAAKMAPCIIFIDEIDTIGKTRDNRMGGNDEREQTLNQLLAEMDGFDPTKGVIVLAATNRPEVLDKALLRPGRFDRRITVDRPNLAGRLATLQVHARHIRLSENVDLNKIAQATAGCVGADLANLVNEAALRAVRLGRKAVNQDDLLVAFETVIAGSEKKNTVITEREKQLIAYHEVGHALVAAKQKGSQPVSKITIVPHTQGALGYTMQLPEEEKFLMSKEDIFTELRTLLAGRSAEEVVFHTMTSGAANDIERATDLARKMITMYGMSEKFGMMGLATVQNQYLDGSAGLTCAQETAAKIDDEIRQVIDACHQDAVRILEENRGLLDSIASYLLKKETITGQEMMAIIRGEDPEAVDNYGAGKESRNNSLPGDPTIEKQARHIRMESGLPTPGAESGASETPPAPDSGAPETAASDSAGSAASENAGAAGSFGTAVAAEPAEKSEDRHDDTPV